MGKPAARRRISGNEIISFMLDRPTLHVIKTMTRRGPIWSFNTLALLDEAACLRLVERGTLVERDPATVGTGPGGAQSYDLNPAFREPAERESRR